MASLYSSLYKYRKSDSPQSQLENFLTEGLCDLLNRLDNDAPRVVEELFGYTNTSGQPLKFKTQRYIDNGYIDLVGYSEDTPCLAIEVKIDAVKQEKQLERYGEWLDKNGEESGILVLLTKDTRPPDDFCGNKAGDKEANEKYKIPFDRRKLVYWHKIIDVFSKLSNSKYWHLFDDYIKFLEEQGVAMKLPDKNDLDKLCAYVQGNSAEKLQAFMERIRNNIKSKYSDLSGTSGEKQQYGGKFYGDGTSLLAWVQHKKERYEIAWGFYFASDKETDPYGFESIFRIPRSNGVWLNVYHYDQAKRASFGWPEKNQLNDAVTWHLAAKDKMVNAPAVAFKSLADFNGDFIEIEKWLMARVDEACEYKGVAVN